MPEVEIAYRNTELKMIEIFKFFIYNYLPEVNKDLVYNVSDIRYDKQTNIFTIEAENCKTLYRIGVEFGIYFSQYLQKRQSLKIIKIKKGEK